MKKTYLLFSAFCASFFNASAQQTFDPSIETEFDKPAVVMPPSPLQYQILFVGGVDQVEGKNGASAAKEQHDFIGVTPDPDSDDLGWISVNHETVEKNENLGDGGGMTVFKLKRDEDTDSLLIVPQTLADGRTGEFFNVDFSATGETGMNCGGIVGPEGRIWTAEEWWRYSNTDLTFPKAYKGDFDTKGIEDTADFLVSTDLTGDFDGTTIRKYENMNYMVEIDPREAKAIRKQYNWGRQPFEGGAISPDGKTVYLGADDAPGFFSKFVADQANDFTSGKLFVYREGLADQGGTYLKKLSTYTASAPFDEGACEISAFDPVSKRLFVINAFQK